MPDRKLMQPEAATIKIKLENTPGGSVERFGEVGKRHLSTDYFEIRLYI